MSRRVGVNLLLAALLPTPVAADFWPPTLPPRASYRVDVRYVAETQQLEGSETIRFRNETRRAIDTIAFRWFGEISSVRVNGAVAARAPGKHPVMLFATPVPLQPGEQAEIAVAFNAQWKLSPRTGSAITSFLNPRLSWGFGTHDDYEVNVRVPDGYTMATTGRRDSRTGALIARDVRAFGLFIGKGYETAEADAGGVLVRALFTSKGRPCAETLLRTAVDAIDFYRQRFGFYPQTTLSIVPGGDEPHGGYPVATGLVVVHGQERFSERQEAFWRWITAHEIGHQYWMEHVLAESDDPLSWLMIGLGIHADREYRRARGIKDAGALETNYVGGVAKGYDAPLEMSADQRSALKWDVNNVIEHGKSAAMLNALESVIGVERFDALYRQVSREYKGRRLGWAAFQQLAEREAGQDLTWFADEWVRSGRSANYRVVDQNCRQSAAKFECTVNVERTGAMRMPITIAARFGDGSEQRARTDRLADVAVLTFRAATPLKEVIVEPDAAVALVEAPSDAARALAAKIGDLPWTDAGEAALAVYREARPLVLSSSVLGKLALTLYDGRYYEEALDVLTRLEPDAGGSSRFMVLVWQGHVLDLLGRRAEAVSRYEDALKVPGEPSMRHEQYGLVINKKWAQERLNSPFERR